MQMWEMNSINYDKDRTASIGFQEMKNREKRLEMV